jgi:Mn2+/Fe2+ NRAMP family transporter
MGTYANSKTFSAIAWTTSIVMIALTLVLIYASFFMGGVPGL